MIVIGAGKACLSAARLLKTKGYDVTVLEASDRLKFSQ
ncbi:NAD(P)-binding protein [Nostoc sp. UHCC 0251]|nr:NAD(P)-binding protein [Nostoc sp. UHCC 0251]MEA5624269.1 NAD(P)-binding protein [Nostoc sp. UHCC 0251]